VRNTPATTVAPTAVPMTGDIAPGYQRIRMRLTRTPAVVPATLPIATSRVWCRATRTASATKVSRIGNAANPITPTGPSASCQRGPKGMDTSGPAASRPTTATAVPTTAAIHT